MAAQAPRWGGMSISEAGQQPGAPVLVSIPLGVPPPSTQEKLTGPMMPLRHSGFSAVRRAGTGLSVTRVTGVDRAGCKRDTRLTL